MITIARATLKAARIFQKDLSNLTDKWLLKNNIAPNASSMLSFIYTHTQTFHPQGMRLMNTCTTQTSAATQTINTTTCPKCLKKDDQPLLKCQKCDVCYRCLGLIPCTEFTSNDHNPKHKRIRLPRSDQTNAHSKRPKPNTPPPPSKHHNTHSRQSRYD